MLKNKAIKKIGMVYANMCPEGGKADTVAGEYVRAAYCLAECYVLHGEMADAGNSNSACACAARYLLQELPEELGSGIGAVLDMGAQDTELYESMLEELIDGLMRLIEDEHLDQVPNGTDFEGCFY